MTATLRDVLKSPLGAMYWRTSCGSFATNGHYGTANDYMLNMFLSCSDGPQTPTRVSMDPETFEHYLHARESEVIRRLRSAVRELAATRRSQGIELLLLRIIETLDLRVKDYYGATVEWDREVPAGTILYYRGAELLGEASGWTA